MSQSDIAAFYCLGLSSLPFQGASVFLILWLQSQSTVILEPQGNKICHCFQFLPFYLPQRDWTGCHDLGFVNVEFQVSFFTLLIHPHQEDLSSSFFSAFRVVSSAYQWLLIFLLEILIPACDFSSLAFHMIHSPYKLNKQGDTYSLDILISQFWISPLFHVWFCSFLIYVRFPRSQVRWSSISICFRMFHSLLWSTQSKAFLNEVNAFLEFLCFLHDSMNVSNLTSVSTVSLKHSLYT